MAETLKNLLVSMRPKQWIKNFFIFAALIFVREFTDLQKVLVTLVAFVLFCLASSAVYLINDIIDLPKDREHPRRRFRPLAAGKLRIPIVAFAATLLSAASILGSFYLDRFFGIAVAAYIVLNIFYSLYLKKQIILDVFIIAFGFVIRVIAGALVIQVPFSPWLILCTFFLTLFLAINKRKNEFLFATTQGARTVLGAYSVPLLDQMGVVALAVTIISYTFYTFSSEHSKLLMFTVPIVLYGLFYYLFIMSQKREDNIDPSDIFLNRLNLQITVLVWILAVTLILIYAR